MALLLRTRSLNIKTCCCLRLLERQKLLNYVATRSYYDELNVSHKKIMKLKKADNVSNSYELIYQAPVTIYFKLAHLSIYFVAAGLPIGSYLIAKENNFKMPLVLYKGAIIDEWWTIAAVNIITFMLGLSTYFLVTRLPLRIYKNQKNDEYISVYFSSLPFVTHKKTFMKGDVERKDVPSPVFLYQTNFLIRGKQTILVEEYFRRPIDLDYMIEKPNTFTESEE